MRKTMQGFVSCLLVISSLVASHAQTIFPRGASASSDAKAPDPIERLSDTVLRIGAIRVDTAKREASIPGRVNNTTVLEFIANTQRGFRAYESAFELETNGISFNLAMIMIGLDKANAVPSTRHFDPNPPGGDPVEVWVEWKAGKETKRVRAEELLWDKEKNERFTQNPWVYTGSVVLPDGRYLADQDAVLIGFVHDPASIIEWTGKNGVGRFGYIQIDPKIGLNPL